MSHTGFTSTHLLRTVVATSISCISLACASAPAPVGTLPSSDSRFHTVVSLDSSGIRPVQRPDTGALPVLTVSQLSESGSPSKRIQLLDAGDKDLPIVLRGLAQSFGLNYQIDSNVHGTVQTRLQDVTLEEALDAIVLPQGYTYSLDNGVLRVGLAKVQTKIFALDYVALSRSASTSTTVQRRIGGGGSTSGGGGGGGSDQISSVSVTDLWDELRIALVALIFDPATGRAMGDSAAGIVSTGSAGNNANNNVGGGGSGARSYSQVAADGRRLVINPVAGTVLVSASPAKLAEVATFMNAFESSIQRQVLIEAKIVEVRLNNDFQFGIDWNRIASGASGIGIQSGTGSASPTVQFTLGGGSSKVNLVLHALQTQGDVSVLSSPRVMAMNNVRANFGVTTDQVFFSVTSTPITNANGVVGTSQTVTPQTISVGIVLDVLPQISADNTVTMNIRPHVTSVSSTSTFTPDIGGQITAPNVDNRDADTMVRTRSGETIVIGGLMQNSLTRTTTGVPGLQSIPLIGGLFRSKDNLSTKSELVIFITATIVAGQPAVSY